MDKNTQGGRSSCLLRSDRALYSIEACSPVAAAAAKRPLHRQDIGVCIADKIQSAHRAQGYWMVRILRNIRDLVLESEVDFQVADPILSNWDRFLRPEEVGVHWVRTWTPCLPG